MSQNKNSDLFNPFYWGIAIFALALISMIAGYFLFPTNVNFPWMISSGFLLVFAIFTNLFNIQTADFAAYVRKGVVSFAGLLISFKYLAAFFSGADISQMQSYRSIYLVIIIGYITIMAICVFVRMLLRKIKERDEKEHGV